MKTQLAAAAAVAALLLAAGPAAPASAQRTAARTPDVHFVPTRMEVVRAMLGVAGVGPEDTVYDLGSGDGRIVVTAAARARARGVGIDIDPERVAEGRRNADSAGVADRVTFRQADLFETDLRPATVVTLYLLPSLNLRLIPKLYRELRPGTRIVSHAFDMGDWKADSAFEVPGESGGTFNVFYWLLPADASGEWAVETDDGTTYRLRLEQRYQQLAGTATVDGREVPVDAARLAGDRIEFTLADQGNKGGGALSFSGRVQGGKAKGTYTDGTGRSRGWTASRTSRGRGPVPSEMTGRKAP